LAPIALEHQILVSQLPQTLSAQRCSNVRNFLCHLERQGVLWSAIGPQPGESRPALLEQWVNTGIESHGLERGTRSALNIAFGLTLQGPSGRVQWAVTFPEHQALMRQLPQTTIAGYRSRICRFLCHLEQQGSSWSMVAPRFGELRPALLESIVNKGINEHGLQGNTRAALNAAFGLTLQPGGGRLLLVPTFPEHQALMSQLPQALRQQQRSNISRFLLSSLAATDLKA
jgi:hypothetical protein